MKAQRCLAGEIQRLVADLPAEIVEAMASMLATADTSNWQGLRVRLLQVATQPGVRARVGEFLQLWESQASGVSADSVLLGLLAACRAEEVQRSQQRIELVWTGPDSHIIPLRRTDQALLQLINEARETLHIVSFAVYRIEAIARALVRAAQRGVSIAIYLETPAASEGRIAFDTIGALGQDIVRCARVYVWPLEKRPQLTDGRHGSLHAKIALADGQTMLMSSANLTEYAMTLNMEMGLLVHGGALPGQVERHLVRLVEQEVFHLANTG
jgi:phosphatidylserine/phosphatidylglycerophosphate/cardiolipin synthase-like enzyme